MKAEYVDHMGDDLRVANAARVSFDKETWYVDDEYVPNKDSRHYMAWSTYSIEQELASKPSISVEDYGLINFLAKHNHWTPFGHPQVTLRMQAPVPIRTQCFKHKQGFVENEESRRYIKSTPELFIPDTFKFAPDNAKQGSGGVHHDTKDLKQEYLRSAQFAIETYEYLISRGCAPEQARFVLPQGCEVNWYWTGSLAAFARFANLRNAGDAQGEIQDLAVEVSDIIQPLFPVSWEALTWVSST